jgi:hypothetical protein
MAYPGYKDQSAKSKTSISAYPLGHKWIAEIQKPWMASAGFVVWIRFAACG